jgi:hypothetical protein
MAGGKGQKEQTRTNRYQESATEHNQCSLGATLITINASFDELVTKHDFQTSHLSIITYILNLFILTVCNLVIYLRLSFVLTQI